MVTKSVRTFSSLKSSIKKIVKWNWRGISKKLQRNFFLECWRIAKDIFIGNLPGNFFIIYISVSKLVIPPSASYSNSTRPALIKWTEIEKICCAYHPLPWTCELLPPIKILYVFVFFFVFVFNEVWQTEIRAANMPLCAAAFYIIESTQWRGAAVPVRTNIYLFNHTNIYW